MADFSRLSKSWTEWTSLAGMTHVSTCTECDDSQAYFKSDDQSFYIQRDGVWWVVDTVDDRGQRRNNVAKFSTFDLLEKYLIWRWSSVTRSAIGARSLGRNFHSLGVKPGVELTATDREYVVEMQLTGGTAVLPASQVGVFSHVLDMPFEEVDHLIREGVG
ncbi:hypothetical protein [Mycolicibacterium alvei]|uniref:Immunity factor for TNT n=1 Tax=Mycolicibacterium alvei TaxID=67081 RepID=A0A6N4UQR6_9MYCO|nr:hypothetical protein [Mycolicibacterium alvei]BBX26213.1 hypothetical protein MALV_13380 [Mycolicibacterium alvei]